MPARHVDLHTAGRGAPPATAVHVLVVSQHDVVRSQLVAYFGRTPGLMARGAAFSYDVIHHAQMDVLVLDLSRLGSEEIEQALDASGQAGSRVVALASILDVEAEQLVTRAGGRYRLKSADTGNLAALVLALAATTAG